MNAWQRKNLRELRMVMPLRINAQDIDLVSPHDSQLMNPEAGEASRAKMPERNGQRREAFQIGCTLKLRFIDSIRKSADDALSVKRRWTEQTLRPLVTGFEAVSPNRRCSNATLRRSSVVSRRGLA
jgi:hypothetical protein